MLCQHPTDEIPVCSASLDKLQNLITQLDRSYKELQGDGAFTWINQNRKFFPGQLWTCAGFKNTAKFAMAEMCAAINRGLCGLSPLGTLPADDFGAWTRKTCGPNQNQQPANSWFVGG